MTDAERRLVEAALATRSGLNASLCNERGREFIAAADAVLAERRPATPPDPLDLLQKVLDRYDQETCTHEETHRGGTIWTICDGCGRKWADDRGGFTPYSDPPEIAQARAVLSTRSAAP